MSHENESNLFEPADQAFPATHKRRNPIEWIKQNRHHFEDADVYGIAILGCWISYHVTYDLCIQRGMPADYASIVAFLADAGQFVYSRKALRATKAGRSAWVLRLFVILLASASFANNVRDAWPSITDISLYSLAPAVWISAHEFMLHGRRKAIKKQQAEAKRKEQEEKISKGLLPAPVAKLGFVPVLLAPWPMFLVKRLMLLTSCAPTEAAQLLIRRAKNGKVGRGGEIKTGKIYFAWVALLQREGILDEYTVEREQPLPPTPPAPKAPLPAVNPLKVDYRKRPFQTSLALPAQPAAAPAPAPVTSQAPAPAPAPTPTPAPVGLAAVGVDGNTPLGKLPEELQKLLLAAIPAKTGPRSKPDSAKLCITVEDICRPYGDVYTGQLAAQLLGVSPSMVSRLKSLIDAERAAKPLAATGS